MRRKPFLKPLHSQPILNAGDVEAFESSSPITRPIAVPTFWNGEPCKARIVRVIVGESPKPTWWCADLKGTEREAVEVVYGNEKYGYQTFYLDNENGLGWDKVTVGRGSPQYGHKGLPVERVLD